jgi:hypothetical protein
MTLDPMRGGGIFCWIMTGFIGGMLAIGIVHFLPVFESMKTSLVDSISSGAAKTQI